MFNSLQEGILVIDVTGNKHSVFFANDIMQNLVSKVLDQRPKEMKATKFELLTNKLEEPLMYRYQREEQQNKSNPSH